MQLLFYKPALRHTTVKGLDRAQCYIFYSIIHRETAIIWQHGQEYCTLILYTKCYKESPQNTIKKDCACITITGLHYDCLMRFLGGPSGGLCWLAKARKASAMRWGWLSINVFQPWVSMTSVAWLKTENEQDNYLISETFHITRGKGRNIPTWVSENDYI